MSTRCESFFRSGRPTEDDEHHVENERRHGDVVEERRARIVREELIERPEEERNRRQKRLRELEGRNSTDTLINEIRDRDGRERHGGKNVVCSRRKEAGRDVPGEERAEREKRGNAEDGR
jgi:hypothetical protein